MEEEEKKRDMSFFSKRELKNKREKGAHTMYEDVRLVVVLV